MRDEWKGKPAKHQFVHSANPGRGPPCTKKANRKLNRIRNLTAKVIQRDVQKLSPEMVTLVTKLWRNRPLPERVTQLSVLCRQDSSDTKSSRELLQKSQKQHKCTEWRNRLRDPSLRGHSRWPAGVAVYDDQGVALTSQETTAKIIRHWRHVWAEQNQADSPSPDAVGIPVPASWSVWCEQDLRAALAPSSLTRVLP